MIDAVKNINNDIKSSLSGFQTKLDADGRNFQKFVVELDKKTNKKEDTTNENLKPVDYKKFEGEIKHFLAQNHLAIEFSIDEQTKKMVMKLIDDETKEVVKQFPSEVSLQIARMLTSNSEGGSITNAIV